MTAQQAIQTRYRPDLKPKSLYPAFHGAAADLARATLIASVKYFPCSHWLPDAK